jgi:hypothetical protein
MSSGPTERTNTRPALTLTITMESTMAKASRCNSNPSTLFQDIAQLRQLWHQHARCDELAISLRGRNKDRMITKLNARLDQLGQLAEDLECRITLTKPRTKFEYDTIVKEINAAQFERSDLIELAWRLGRASVALGISTPPQLETVDGQTPRRLAECATQGSRR